jgi:hypothetical protein
MLMDFSNVKAIGSNCRLAAPDAINQAPFTMMGTPSNLGGLCGLQSARLQTRTVLDP